MILRKHDSDSDLLKVNIVSINGLQSQSTVLNHTAYMLDWPIKTWHLTHWDWVTHICIGKLTIIGSDDGLACCLDSTKSLSEPTLEYS